MSYLATGEPYSIIKRYGTMPCTTVLVVTNYINLSRDFICYMKVGYSRTIVHNSASYSTVRTSMLSNSRRRSYFTSSVFTLVHLVSIQPSTEATNFQLSISAITTYGYCCSIAYLTAVICFFMQLNLGIIYVPSPCIYIICTQECTLVGDASINVNGRS